MRKISIQLLDEEYFALQIEAGENGCTVDEYAENLLKQKVDTTRVNTKRKGAEDKNEQDSFRKFIIRWDWSGGKLREGTEQCKNVVGVIENMRKGYTFNESVKKHAEEARRENPLRGVQYDQTVRASCTKRGGQGVTSSVEEFKLQVKNLLDKYAYTNNDK